MWLVQGHIPHSNQFTAREDTGAILSSYASDEGRYLEILISCEITDALSLRDFERIRITRLWSARRGRWSETALSYFEFVEQTRCVVVSTNSSKWWFPGSMIRQRWPVLMLNKETERRASASAGQATISPTKWIFQRLGGMVLFDGSLIRREAAGSPCRNRWSCSAFRRRRLGKVSTSFPHRMNGSVLTNHWSRRVSKIFEQDNVWYHAFETYIQVLEYYSWFIPLRSISIGSLRAK